MNHIAEIYDVYHEIVEDLRTGVDRAYKVPFWSSSLLSSKAAYKNALKAITTYEVKYEEIDRETRGFLNETTIFQQNSSIDHIMAFIHNNLTYTVKCKSSKEDEDVAGDAYIFMDKILEYKRLPYMENNVLNNDKKVLFTYKQKLRELKKSLTNPEKEEACSIFSFSHTWLNHLFYESVLRGNLKSSLALLYTAHFSLMPCKFQCNQELRTRPVLPEGIRQNSAFPFMNVICKYKIVQQFIRRVFGIYTGDIDFTKGEVNSHEELKQLKFVLERTRLDDTDARAVEDQAKVILSIKASIEAHFGTDEISTYDLCTIILSDQYLVFVRKFIAQSIRLQMFKNKNFNQKVYITYENVENSLHQRFMTVLKDSMINPQYLNVDLQNQDRLFPKGEYYMFYPTDIICLYDTLTSTDVLNIYEVCVNIIVAASNYSGAEIQIDESNIFRLKNPLFCNFLVYFPFIRIFCSQIHPSQMARLSAYILVDRLKKVLSTYMDTFVGSALMQMLTESHDSYVWYGRFFAFLRSIIPRLKEPVPCEL